MPGFKLYEVSGYPTPLRLSEDHAETLGGKEIDTTTTTKPSKQDSKATWSAYAVSQGADPATAETTTKADLIAQYG
jgi:hypothetical protein